MSRRNVLDEFDNLRKRGYGAEPDEVVRVVSRMKRDNYTIKRLIARCGWYEQEIKKLKGRDQ